MGRSGWLAVACIAAFAAPGTAQSIARTISCTDRNGRALMGVQVTNGIIAKATMGQDGRAVIEYDPRPIAGISSQQQLFVYAHECGHFALGHDLQSLTGAQEQEADCSAIRFLVNKFGFTARDLGILQADMRQLGPGDARHLPWATRTYNLEVCLAAETSDAGAARDTRASEADDCVMHQDGTNAILDESRGRRSIKGTYMAANRCTHDVTCIFTIETGTLPDADFDADSWSRFLVQKTRTEPHALKAGSEVEFRFEEMLDTPPGPGESVDFRVLKACR